MALSNQQTLNRFSLIAMIENNDKQHILTFMKAKQENNLCFCLIHRDEPQLTVYQKWSQCDVISSR